MLSTNGGRMKQTFTPEEVLDLLYAEVGSYKRGHYTNAERNKIRKILKDVDPKNAVRGYYSWAFVDDLKA